MNNRFDAVLVPGGGIIDSMRPTPWVQKRLDKALEIVGDGLIITLSAGTTHKAPLLDERGFPIFESIVSANYLTQKGFDGGRVLVEHHSYDTIGNAFFARTIHTESRILQKLAVVTSDFHMVRTKKIFDWIFSLPPQHIDYSLEYVTTETVGMEEEVLRSRIMGEKRRIAALEKVSPGITTLSSLHRWLFKHHAAYAVTGLTVPTTEKELGSY